MRKLRTITANALIVALLGLSAVSIAADRELWPFSPYPMYSVADAAAAGAKPGDLGTEYELFSLRLYGVPRDGAPERFLTLRYASLSHYHSLARLVAATPVDDAGIRAIVSEVLAGYTARRAATEPELAAVRLYALEWEGDAPSQLHLLAEVRAP